MRISLIRLALALGIITIAAAIVAAGVWPGHSRMLTDDPPAPGTGPFPAPTVCERGL